MLTLIDVAGCIMVGLGIFVSLGGCTMAHMGQVARSFPFWLGVGLIAIGRLLSSMAARKTCPHCSERVSHKAIKCRHCGSDLAATPSTRVSDDPFYR